MREIGHALLRWQRFLWLVVLAFLVSTGCGSRTTQGARITSYANLHKIGTAIRDYADDHEAHPYKLSALVPRYIHLDQLDIFYVTNNDAQNPSRPPDWATNPSHIDRFSSYVYLGTNNRHNILAFERLDLWKPNAPHPFEVAVLFSDYHVQYIQNVRLRELIPEIDPVAK